MLAYCGLNCETCNIYLATFETDLNRQKTMRKEMAIFCNKHYKLNLKPEDINDCDGCMAESGRIFSGCVKCGIRQCAIEKKLENCSYCNEYPCDMLLEHFKMDPESKEKLDEIRSAI